MKVEDDLNSSDRQCKISYACTGKSVVHVSSSPMLFFILVFFVSFLLFHIQVIIPLSVVSLRWCSARKGRLFEPISRHVGSWVKSFTRSCLYRHAGRRIRSMRRPAWLPCS